MAQASEKTVLVVDDEPDVRDFIATCLEDAGFQVKTAVDGVDALEKIEASIPDLMTLDMVMPRRSGLSLMRKLRKNDKWKEIPVIVITAHAQDEFASEDVKELLVAFEAKQQPRHIMEKPITPPKLIDAVSEILEVSPDGETAGGKDNLLQAIKQADAATLQQIQSLLAKEKG
mgnify:CR=1 FL=1|jgi:CheY-like chemotaxis protein